jgi:dephospho-CoA kinase
MVFAVALTGGIGSGKTTASDLFGELGADVIDTDEIARALTAGGQPAVAQITKHFGPDVANADGSLNRARMREIAFHDEHARLALEKILHPLIGAEVRRRLSVSPGPYALVVIPLLTETRGHEYARRIAVVDCSEEQQISRVTKRSNLSYDQVLAIMATQATRKNRLAIADDVIDNGDSPQAIHAQVDSLHRMYLKLAN